MEIILIVLMILIVLLLIGLGLGGFIVYRKLTEKPKVEVTTFDEEVKKMFDLEDKQQKQQYDELMEAWNYTHKKKELKDVES